MIQQYFMQVFLVDSDTRRLLKMPNQLDIDLRISCACCNKITNYGFACAYCLSLYCQETEEKGESKCRMCGTRFDFDYTAE